MNHVLLIGATGSLGRVIASHLNQQKDIILSVLARNPQRLPHGLQATVFQGDVENATRLSQAIKGQNAVIFCLSGDLPHYFAKVQAAMQDNHVKRIIAISSIGIYQQPISPILTPYRELADAVEQSGLDYTLIRPDWFTHENKIAYQLTTKGEPELPGQVSRLSIADYIYHALSDTQQIGKNVGISCP